MLTPILVSKQNRLLVFMLSELKLLQGGGKGMLLIDLKEGDELTACTVVNRPAMTLSGTASSKVQQLQMGGKELQGYLGLGLGLGRWLSLGCRG